MITIAPTQSVGAAAETIVRQHLGSILNIAGTITRSRANGVPARQAGPNPSLPAAPAIPAADYEAEIVAQGANNIKVLDVLGAALAVADPKKLDAALEALQ